MPVGKWGRLEVEGRRVLIFDGINTQTVNVYAGAEDADEKEIIVRLSQPYFTTAEQLIAQEFATVAEMQTYLVKHHRGEVQASPARLYREFSERLAEIATTLRAGEASPTPTVREFLAMVGAQRRGPGVVASIREQLAAHSLVTDPDFQPAYVDSRIRFVLTRDAGEDADVEGQADNGGLTPQVDLEATYADPTYLISKFPTANRPPERAHPDETLRAALTRMDLRGLAHMPVMGNERDVRGVLSLKHLLPRWEQARPDSPVRDFMDSHSEIVDSTASLFSVLSRLADHEYILVRSSDRTIVGSITADDMVRQFREMTEPFLLLSEIEHHLRGLIAPRFTAEELRGLCSRDYGSPVDSVDKMSFGDYVCVLENPREWAKLGIGSDGTAVVEHMRRVNQVRNRVMHFDPDGIEPDDLEELRSFAAFLRRLRPAAPA